MSTPSPPPDPVDRELEIEAFRSQEYWTIDGTFTTPKGAEFQASLNAIAGNKLAKLDIKDEATARAAGDETRAADCRALAERKTRLLHRLHQLPRGETYPLQVVLWHIGDAIWLGVQGESYSLLQTELRRRFPDRIILVASIAADWGASYLPPRDLYDTGIYQETIAVVAAGSLEQLIEAVAERITVGA